MVLPAKSFDTIDFRIAELIKMAHRVELEFSNSDIASLSREERIEQLCEAQKPKQVLAAIYGLMLHISYVEDTIDFMAAANHKADIKRPIELVVENRNMTSVPKNINCPT